MADPFKAENDDEWSQWFDALHEYHKAKVIKAVTGASNEFSLRDGAASQNSNITLLPHRFFNEVRVKEGSVSWTGGSIGTEKSSILHALDCMSNLQHPTKPTCAMAVGSWQLRPTGDFPPPTHY